MSPIRNQIMTAVDNLQDSDLTIIWEVVRRFLPEETPSDDDIAAIREGREEYLRGETVSHEDINWD